MINMNATMPNPNNNLMQSIIEQSSDLQSGLEIPGKSGTHQLPLKKGHHHRVSSLQSTEQLLNENIPTSKSSASQLADNSNSYQNYKMLKSMQNAKANGMQVPGQGSEKQSVQSIKEMEERLFSRRKNRQIQQEIDKTAQSISKTKMFGNRKDLSLIHI